MPAFYTIIARKIFFPIFWEGAGAPTPAPVSYVYVPESYHIIKSLTALNITILVTTIHQKHVNRG